jgi:hypothetical protein
MQTYTFHLPRGADPADRSALDGAALVKDGFSWGAFFFTGLWFFWHRLWLAGIAALVAVVGFALLLRLLGVAPAAAGLAEFLLAVLIGLEANALRRWTYARQGRGIADVVTARSRAEAELKAIARALAVPERGGAAALAPSAYRPEPVIGLFPDPERGR